MKLKGVNPIVQHIEKVVLGVTVLIFLAVISLQFVSEPNKVSTGTREVAPDQIYNELASTANSLQSQISDLSPALPSVQPVDLVSRFNNANTDATTKLSIPLGQGFDIALALGSKIDPQGPGKILDIESMPVPTTSTPLAASTWGTLDPYAVLQVPQYADFVPTAQPFDFPSVTIEADFPGTTLRNVLEGNDGYPGVPRLFWTSPGMAIMGLDVQRQQLLANGSWSESESITPPPSTPLPSTAVTNDDGLVRLNTIINNAQSVADEIMRPMFPPTISGPDWEAPSESIDTKDLGLTDTQRLQRTLARLESQLDALNKTPRTRTTTSSGSGKSATGGRGGRGGSSNKGTPNSSDRNKKRIKQIEQLIEDAKENLEKLGVVAKDSAQASSDILDQEFVQLWAHDMGVTPGTTYRYRTRVVLNNPYFRKGPYLDEADPDQQALTIEPFATGDWSQWSTPVAVGAKEFFFVADATQPLIGAELPQAKIELYSMYYGYYRRSSMTIEPGQPLFANLRVSGDLVLFDTNIIKADDAASFIDTLNSGQNNPELPDGVIEAPDRLSINLKSFLIQVAQDPIPSVLSPDQTNTRLIFRLPDGSLQYRNSARDRDSTIYSQAQSSSAKASRAKLRPTGQPAKSDAFDLFKRADP